MDKALKLNLFQETACYKKPFAFKTGETYPLPPYSTVKGMLHYVLKAKRLIPMRLSIQGNYESKFQNYQSMYFFKDKEITKMPLNVHLLYNVNLIIHVSASDQVLEQIMKALRSLDEYLSLGRKEDIVRIDNVKYVELHKYSPLSNGKTFSIKNPIYIPTEFISSDVSGINYRLNCTYKIVNNLRQWDKVDVKYVESKEEISDKEVLLDDDNDLVYFDTTL